MTPLNYAQRDAESIRDFFLNELKFDRVDLFASGSPQVKYDDGPPLLAEPTIGNLDSFFDRRFEHPFLESGDNLWFFFAGHGKRDRGIDYLMPIDGSIRRLEKTALSVSYVAERLRRSGADNVILMLDACRDDGAKDGGEGIKGIQKGLVTLYSCSPNELAYEIEPLKQGAFTHALIEGLRIQGEGNCATVERLCQHLKYRVPELTKHHKNRTQTPYTVSEPDSKMHLILLPDRANLQDVQRLKNDAKDAELELEFDLADQLWTRVLVASPGDREAIRAFQRIAVKRLTEPVQVKAEASKASEPVVSRGVEAIQENTISDSRIRFEVVRVNAQGKIIDRQNHQAEQSLVTLGKDVDLGMLSIPAGEFWMGAKDQEEGAFDEERPRHLVTVKAFWMGKYPVTQKQWKAIARLKKVNIDLKPDCSKFKGDDLPVEQVSWYEAVEFCDRLSRQTGQEYTLPTEAQWEYACRANTETPFHFGETITTELANYRGTDWEYDGTTYSGKYAQGSYGDYRQKTTPVSQFDYANAFGLYDMHGNTLEWCLDHWHENYEGAPTDSSPWLTENDNDYRLLRGGSWFSFPVLCRSSYRYRHEPDVQLNYVGFRVVCLSARAF